MKTLKYIIIACVVIVMTIICTRVLFVKTTLPDVQELRTYCKNNNYNTDYCLLMDFSKHRGTKRFYVYDFNKNQIIYRSACAQGFGKHHNVFAKKRYSNEIGSCLSSVGKYRVGELRPMSNPYFGQGYTVYGLDKTNSNALQRAILIHNGSPEFETFPLPCLPVSKGCFAVSNSMMEEIAKLKKQSKKPLLLYAYK